MNVFVPDGPWNYANGLQAVWAADSKSIFIARSRRQEGKGYELWVAEGENGGRLLDTAFASIVRMRTLSNGGLLVVGHRQGEQNRRTLYQCNYGAVGAQACEAIATDVRVAGTSVDKGVIAYATYAASGETRCIWITSARSKQPRCAVSVRDNVGSISVSPDGTNLLYTLPRYIGREGTADTYTYDIFVVSLAKE
jgi:hypothetical protein